MSASPGGNSPTPAAAPALPTLMPLRTSLETLMRHGQDLNAVLDRYALSYALTFAIRNCTNELRRLSGTPEMHWLRRAAQYERTGHTLPDCVERAVRDISPEKQHDAR